MALLALQPRRPEFADGHVADGRGDVLPSHLVDLDLVGEPLGIPLGCEAALVGLPIVRCPVADAVKRCTTCCLVLANGCDRRVLSRVPPEARGSRGPAFVGWRLGRRGGRVPRRRCGRPTSGMMWRRAGRGLP